MNNEISLVTGGNGHLANNLIRLLLSKNIKVRTTVRSAKKQKAISDLDCEVFIADITDKKALEKAMQGVTNVYAVAANFKMWSKNAKKDIYDTNLLGTQNVFDAAKICSVKNIVYVSSVASLDFTKLPANVNNGYNKDRRNWYYNSKNDSDKLALELARKYHIRTVLVLPSAMIGAKAYNLSYSNQLLQQVLDNQIPLDTGITLNWIDVKDVAQGTYEAMIKGRNLERYILANEQHTTLTETVQIAKKIFPELQLRTPKKAPLWLLYTIASLMEIFSKITGKEPLLQKHYLDMFYGLKQNYDIHNSKKQLGFNPKPSKLALEEAIKYLQYEYQQ